MRDNIFIYSAIKQKKGSIHYRTTQQMDVWFTAHLYKIVNNVFWGFKRVGLFPPSRKYQFLFSLNLVYLKPAVSLSRMFEETDGLSFHPAKLVIISRYWFASVVLHICMLPPTLWA